MLRLPSGKKLLLAANVHTCVWTCVWVCEWICVLERDLEKEWEREKRGWKIIWKGERAVYFSMKPLLDFAGVHFTNILCKVFLCRSEKWKKDIFFSTFGVCTSKVFRERVGEIDPWWCFLRAIKEKVVWKASMKNCREPSIQFHWEKKWKTICAHLFTSSCL